MRLMNRHRALVKKHHEIEAKIEAELRRPLPDSFVVQRLKRLKLVIKDDIVSARRRLGEVRSASA